MSLVRRTAKTAVLPLGFPGCRGDDLSMLLYHKIGAGDREVDITVPAFDRQVGRLADRGSALAIDDALGPPMRGGVVVTFDDGFRDFTDNALPVLVRHRVPAILYLTTGWVHPNAGSANGSGCLSWPDLRDAVSTGLVTVGSHTHTHPDLSSVRAEEAHDEMRRSQELIEDRLAVPCRHFAYPFSMAGEAADHVARELFDSAALLWGRNRPGRTDLHRLGRVPVLRSDGPMFFRAKVDGLLDREALIYRLTRRGPWRRS